MNWRLSILLGALWVTAPACDQSATWTTQSGLKITELRDGDGARAMKGDEMAIIYKASFVGGKTFDTQLDPESPYRFRLGVDKVMPGLYEGVQTMRPGAKRILVMPPELAYGKDGLPGTVPPNSWIRFEVELVAIKALPPAPDPWNEIGYDIFTAPSGLQFVDFVIGDGKAPTRESIVSVMYTAFLEDGVAFDTTYIRGLPMEFSLAESPLILGWLEGLLSMREGGRRKIIVPPHLGYGAEGYRDVVPPNATLIYDIELVEVR